MKALFAHLKRYVLRGLIALIPIALTVFLIGFLYRFADQRISRPISDLIGFQFPGLGLLALLLALYLAGLLLSSFVGHAILRMIETAASRIPLIGQAYGVGKQLSETLTLPERSVFRRAVLVEYLNAGTWTIGFVTGALSDERSSEARYLCVFVPTPPNPLSGTMIIAPESRVRDPGWGVEEALQAVLSGGILGPKAIR